jgi:hypothetical protein
MRLAARNCRRGTEALILPAVRFFMAKNRDLEKHAHYPEGWAEHGFVSLKAIEGYENRWGILAQSSN